MPDRSDQSLGAPWWSEFHSFGGQHVVVVACAALLVAGVCWRGRRWLKEGRAGRARERRLCAAWAGFVICVNVWSIVYWLLPEHFDIKQSLPLQMCDLGMLLAPMIFLLPAKRCRAIRSIIYFWGIGLSTQAFITPTVTEGIGHARYWLFWLGHLSIVGSAVYDLIVRGFRPRFRDFLTTTGITLAWYAGVGVLNAWLGSNYGYNGRSVPGSPTVIDRLGAYPERVFILGAIVIALFVVLWAVWPLGDRIRGRTRALQIQ